MHRDGRTGMTSGFTAQATALGDSAWRRVYDELCANRIPLPMQSHPDWQASLDSSGGYLVTLRDSAGTPVFAYLVELSSSRALPHHWLMRACRFGATDTVAVASAGVLELARLAARHKNLLRVYLEVFSANQAVRQGIGQCAGPLGFVRSQPLSKGYENTLALNLGKSEEALFQDFSPSARRNIRAATRKGLAIRTISSGVYAPRMSALLRETLARTGGSRSDQNWHRVIEFSNAHPELSRLAGCFLTDVDAPAALLSFAWGCNHGDHVTHTAAASTRRPGCNLPLSYAIAWDLILWAKHNGAQWFDFGGITEGSLGTADSLGGISDFKRFFGSDVISVGEEWTLEPSRIKAQVSRLIGSTARWIDRLAHSG